MPTQGPSIYQSPAKHPQPVRERSKRPFVDKGLVNCAKNELKPLDSAPTLSKAQDQAGSIPGGDRFPAHGVSLPLHSRIFAGPQSGA
jgi:hypothetical protein